MPQIPFCCRLQNLRHSLGTSYTSLRQYTQVTPEIAKSVLKVFEKSAAPLTPAQVAFSHRIGVADVLGEDLRIALTHCEFRGGTSSTFKKYRRAGMEAIKLFAEEYVEARFPRLPPDSHEMAVSIYCAPPNIATIAKSVGLEYALVPFAGIPNVKMPTINAFLDSKKVDLKPVKYYSDVMQAIVGLILYTKNALEVRKFLDSHFFSATFDVNLLCRPKSPMLKLARIMVRLKRPEPQYRLLHETGRLSTSSIYVVGAYSGVDKLAEAHGPSYLVAQERAAVEALRKLFVVQVPDAGRRSDKLADELSATNSLEDLEQLFRKKVTL